MIKNPYIKLAVLCIGVVLIIVREHDYYQAHGRVSDGVIGAGVTLGVMAVASLVYWSVTSLARKIREPYNDRQIT